MGRPRHRQAHRSSRRAHALRSRLDGAARAPPRPEGAARPPGDALSSIVASRDQGALELTGWSMQSSAAVAQAGAEISATSFPAAGWLPVSLPATFIGGLVQNGLYPDPFTGLNFQALLARA